MAVQLTPFTNATIPSLGQVQNATVGLRSMFYMVSATELANNQQTIIEQAYLWFFALISIEFIVGKLRGHKTYRLNDSITSLLLGIVSEQCKIWGKTAIFYGYERLHAKYGVVTFNDETSLGAFLFAMFMIDFFYYWFHRFCHEYHFAWGQHSVHHSGEDYNLATALRQGAFQWVIGFAFTLPLAFVIPPQALFGHFFANTLAQFWFHTSQIGWMGPLEYIINTPSSHRMHHRPPGNCNYGGVLIIFDKVFGTYVGEREHLDYYGLAKQYETFDPVWAHMEHTARVVNNVDNGGASVMSLLRRRVKHKFVFDLPALFRGPGFKPEKSLWQLPTQPYRPKLDKEIPFLLNAYIVFVFVVQLLAFLNQSEDLKTGRLTLGFELAVRQLLSFSAMSSIGRLFNGFSKGRSRNLARVLITPCVLAYLIDSTGKDAWMYYASLVDLVAFIAVSMELIGTKH